MAWRTRAEHEGGPGGTRESDWISLCRYLLSRWVCFRAGRTSDRRPLKCDPASLPRPPQSQIPDLRIRRDADWFGVDPVSTRLLYLRAALRRLRRGYRLYPIVGGDLPAAGRVWFHRDCLLHCRAGIGSGLRLAQRSHQMAVTPRAGGTEDAASPNLLAFDRDHLNDLM